MHIVRPLSKILKKMYFGPQTGRPPPLFFKAGYGQNPSEADSGVTLFRSSAGLFLRWVLFDLGALALSRTSYHSLPRKRESSFTPSILLSPQNLRFCEDPKDGQFAPHLRCVVEAYCRGF
jgi:hypothetical protein